jgi:hypothetical protein
VTAFDYCQKYQRTPQGSTTATHKPSKQDIHRATGSTAVDYHVEQATSKE